MKPITKADFLKLLDEHLPDDAMISAISGMACEGFVPDVDNLSSIITLAEDQDPDDVVPKSTHVLVTL